MKKRDVVEAIIYNDKKEILMQKKTIDYPICPGGIWCFFGGEVEEGENPLETLKREIEEETGIKINEEDAELIYKEDYNIDTRFEGTQCSYKIKFKGKLDDIKLREGLDLLFLIKLNWTK